MTDVLIRDVPGPIIGRIDELAAERGLSRGEFLRRHLEQLAGAERSRCTTDDLRRTADVFSDVLDPAVMELAWR